jgi:hypothetical protein
VDICFIRSEDRRDQTIVKRQDSVRLRIPVYGPLEPILHDLAHDVVETELSVTDGLWASVAAGAVLEGMTVVEGRQRPHARERSHAIQVANRRGILAAEIAVGVVMRAMKGERLEDAQYSIESSVITLRTRADYDNLIRRLRQPIEDMMTRWQSIPMGDSLIVVWPDHQARNASSPLTRRRACRSR